MRGRVRMRLRCAIALSLAALVFSSGAKAESPPAPGAVNAIVQTAAVTREIAQMASAATVGPETAVPAEVSMPTPASLTAETRTASAKHSKDKLADKSAKPHRDKAAEPEALCVRPIGKAETGTAAWYGGRYVGRRTSSGSRLDTIHPTAAHRTLPLNSLARVTNLDNGRSVVVRVTDRGPVSASLLIDMSPRAAAELQMKHAGLVPVAVEQVVEVPADPK
jgi:rare lipoprotein A